MPSDKHEKAVRFIVEAIKAEHHDRMVRVGYAHKTAYGCIPDAWITIDTKVIVVEVGDTSAEKIFKYLDDPHVHEVRWYTKSMDLAGTWTRDDKGQTIFSKDTRRQINKRVRLGLGLEKLQTEIKRLNDQRTELYRENHLYLDKKLYAVCPYCHQTFQVITGHTKRHGGYKLLWCGGCRKINSQE